MSPNMITIVSGLPRSGTSMMMKALEAGGMSVLTDNLRQSDADNPQGYYEFERVKQLSKGDYGWLGEAQGKAVKIIAALLEYLPADYTYKVVFMRRRMDEILASQKKMLIRRGAPSDKLADAEMRILFERHLAKVQTWLKTQSNISVLEVDYNQLLENPRPCLEEISQFLANGLDVEKMVGAVDPGLYRNRSR